MEITHAICPNCRILLVEATSNSVANLLAAEDYAVKHANIVSNSWGGDEFSAETTSTYNGHFNHPGIPITFSSGDTGYGVQFPASSQYVTAVGGTTLILNSNNTRSKETVWSGAGSGCSAYVAKPTWQKDSGCIRRTVADVSADANPTTGAAVYDSVIIRGIPDGSRSAARVCRRRSSRRFTRLPEMAPAPSMVPIPTRIAAACST